MTSPKKTVLSVEPLNTTPWKTDDPFLFCVHHLDAYPEGDDQMAPDPALLAGRNIGSDFSGKDGWSMYHGDKVPGFPQHPHRGFETVSIARQGFIDHSDSLGAHARFGDGDVQWMTAGKGVVHSEIFPLIHRDKPNTMELFQIWLNLPRENKLVEPHFTMLWGENIPKKTFEDDKGKKTTLTVIAGPFEELSPPSPPPESWAANPDNNVAIWTLKLEPGAKWTAPAAPKGVNRVFYVFEGRGLKIDGTNIPNKHRAKVDPTASLTFENGPATTEILMLQGQPIKEPVAQHGPFVMNYPGEIRQAMIDYHNTHFGGWPWEEAAPVHPREEGRFAVHADGRREQPD